MILQIRVHTYEIQFLIMSLVKSWVKLNFHQNYSDAFFKADPPLCSPFWVIICLSAWENLPTGKCRLLVLLTWWLETGEQCRSWVVEWCQCPSRVKLLQAVKTTPILGLQNSVMKFYELTVYYEKQLSQRGVKWDSAYELIKTNGIVLLV